MNSVETGEDPLDGAKVGKNRVSVMSLIHGTLAGGQQIGHPHDFQFATRHLPALV
jgi:hypothetical protein